MFDATVSLLGGDSARVRVAVAPMLASPRIASVQTSQLTAGHVVALLERDKDWWSVRSHDGYEGWMHFGYLEPASGNESDWPMTTGSTVREGDGRIRALPFGALVSPDAMLLSGEAYDDDERARDFPPHPAQVAASAESYFAGASYLWGGVTPWGCDCSGFVQAIAALHDVHLPRDAWQQANMGSEVVSGAFEGGVIHAADLLFFSDRDDRRITHVGMALEGLRMVHSALARGGVSVDSLTGDDKYAERLRAQFVTARRIVSPPDQVHG